jgi:hypothetical protein
MRPLFYGAVSYGGADSPSLPPFEAVTTGRLSMHLMVQPAFQQFTITPVNQDPNP